MSKRFVVTVTMIICLALAASAQSAPGTAQPPAQSSAQTPAAQTPAAGQPPAGQKFTLAATLQRSFQNLQRNLAEAADKMPEADYSFKPTPTMRPFSQLVAHIALAQFNTCSRVKGETNPNQDKKEESITTKAEAVALLKASATLCTDAFSAITDANVTDLVKAGPNESAKGNFIAGANAHGNELYGFMAAYLRLKNIVPPTTERQEQQRRSAAPAEQPKPATSK